MSRASVLVALLFLLALPLLLPAQTVEAPSMTGRYHFLGPEDTLAVLQEEAILKGYIDVFQGENESNALLSYPITIGSRKGNHVEFRTRKIHEKYYRFTGLVERGSGHKPGDPDYLQLAGELDTITSNSVTGEHKTERQQVIFKSMGRNEQEP
ncbi:MAG: hypothetical protein ACRD2B_11690 [Terriglobia bacterium]